MDFGATVISRSFVGSIGWVRLAPHLAEEDICGEQKSAGLEEWINEEGARDRVCAPRPERLSLPTYCPNFSKNKQIDSIPR